MSLKHSGLEETSLVCFSKSWARIRVPRVEVIELRLEIRWDGNTEKGAQA